jgi:maltooligosyltrehalose trehalohydrolase
MGTKRLHQMPFGAEIGPEGTRFRLWAPDARSVSLKLNSANGEREIPLQANDEGWCVATVDGARPGNRYQFRINGELLVPDPASRFQPDDVHGASEIIDPAGYAWNDADWRGHPWEEVVLYELHVGTFTPEGTFAGVIERLDHLLDLGVTAVELMPVADFVGARGWGYDGVYLYAPDARYGRPEDLKRLIDEAHARGLMVFLDVVYNHFGPAGNYLHVYAREHFFNWDRETPWGAAINFERSRVVRDFYVHNVLYWLDEYHFDGLRFDAVHAIEDPSEPDILDEIAEAVHARMGDDRHVHLVLENEENEAHRLRRGADHHPLTFTAQWNDDIHHAFHTLLTGESKGYYQDYADAPMDHLLRCLTTGFSYQGQPSKVRKGGSRGEASGDLPPLAFVAHLQNHDQVGNRAFGDRIAQLAPIEGIAAVTAVLLLAPQIPMLFMGQEWGTKRPFQFFCDLGPELEDAVRDGRRREFAAFPEFADPKARERIPDPTAESTYQASMLDWSELDDPDHQQMLDLHRELLDLRMAEIVPRLASTPGGSATIAWNEGAAFMVAWQLGDASTLRLLANLSPEPANKAPQRPGGMLIFANFELPGENTRRLPPWSVAWFLDEAKGTTP